MNNAFYFSTILLRPARRAALSVVESIHGTIDAIPASCSDPGVAQAKLEWWRDEAARMVQGQPRHPLTAAARDRCVDIGVLHDAAVALIDALQVEHRTTPPGCEQERLDWYLQAYGLFYLARVRMCDPHAPADVAGIRELGAWIEVANDLIALRARVKAGLRRQPRVHLAAYGIDWQDFVRPRDENAVADFVSAEAQTIGAALAATIDSLPSEVVRAARPVTTLGRIAEATLAEVVHDGCRVWQHRVELTGRRKLWIAVRTRFRPRAGHAG
jgi:phytoene synthase